MKRVCPDRPLSPDSALASSLRTSPYSWTQTSDSRSSSEAFRRSRRFTERLSHGFRAAYEDRKRNSTVGGQYGEASQWHPYVLSTPARNEATFIELMIQSVVRQTIASFKTKKRFVAHPTQIVLVRLP